MSLARNTAKPLLAALAVALVAVPLGACGREEEADLSAGKAQFVQKCGSCHTLNRAGTQGNQGPNLDTSFQAALARTPAARMIPSGSMLRPRLVAACSPAP